MVVIEKTRNATIYKTTSTKTNLMEVIKEIGKVHKNKTLIIEVRVSR